MKAPDDLATRVTSKTEFSAFLAALAADARRNAATWENNDLPRFLEALAAWHKDAEAFYRNTGQSVDVSAPSWRLFADMLSAARVYE